MSSHALLSALGLAEEHTDAAGGAGVDEPELDHDRGRGLLEIVTRLLDGGTPGEAVGEALALGFLAGCAAPGAPRRGPSDPSSFLIGPDLLVRGAVGESVMRLPWFQEDMFIGRLIPDIGEMPERVRNQCVENYSAGLAGTRSRFAFTSYGHSFRVDTFPVRDDNGRVKAVVGIAHPVPRAGPALKVTRLTAREVEILQLAAFGMSGPQIADHLVLSPGTVKTHFQNIYIKWDVSDRAAAVAEALRQGLID
jgi:DNA-binding CsgD family transcriptional regulator